MDEEEVKSNNESLLEPKVSLNQRACRITFSVKNRSQQTKDSFIIDEFPMKNS
ncbi:unnamed protein product [Gongylonema pulchrum]|uniref:MSP domain-containing protein n=1 Tax=Gongylonema pulchrum TaxID=637853 RepID=A0A183DYQ0_9BILA|nr:unnamed protein product [Gongylonema pulchrum]